MAGLVLKMAPKERVLINGAVIENGDRRSRFTIVTPNANVLRLKDAIHPDHADTPLGRICFDLQLILSGHINAEEIEKRTLNNIDQVCKIFGNVDQESLLETAKSSMNEGKYYSALKSIKQLLPLERELLEKPAKNRDRMA